jgi:ribosomal protein S12 methylthiotransferase accessory factor YcaO
VGRLADSPTEGLAPGNRRSEAVFVGLIPLTLRDVAVKMSHDQRLPIAVKIA